MKMSLASIKIKLKWLKHNFMKIRDYAMLNLIGISSMILVPIKEA